ncbi:MAG: hypothetical protein D6704_06090 [Nitrospirae bacterium]|nr:MAG: hypothetical protein D6704_06090 [Nitrospirota bacterium]
MPARYSHVPRVSLSSMMGMLIALAASMPWIDCVHAHEVAILQSAEVAAYRQAIDAFQAHLLSQAGLTVTTYNLQGSIERGRKLGQKLRASDVSVVLAVGTKAAIAAKLELVDIPVIYCMVLYPERYALTAPNMTGIQLHIPPIRQFALIKKLIPHIQKIGVVFDPDRTAHLIQQAQQGTAAQGLTLIQRSVSSQIEVPSTVRALLAAIDALWLVPDSTVLSEDSFNFLLKATLDAKVPLIGFSPELARSGALLSIYVDYTDVGKQAAELANRILRGSPIPTQALLPLQHVRYAINQKIADYLGIPIPARTRLEADHVF